MPKYKPIRGNSNKQDIKSTEDIVKSDSPAKTTPIVPVYKPSVPSTVEVINDASVTLSADSIKITELPNIGNEIAPNTLIPVVNLAGDPITQKANIQITGNLILAGAGGANFLPAALAEGAYNVINAVQPAITGLGVLSNLEISGNLLSNNLTVINNSNLGNSVIANYFVGDGTALSNIGNAKRLVDGGSSVVIH